MLVKKGLTSWDVLRIVLSIGVKSHLTPHSIPLLFRCLRVWKTILPRTAPSLVMTVREGARRYFDEWYNDPGQAVSNRP